MNPWRIFGDLLRRTRPDAFSMGDMARAMEMSVSDWSGIETGRLPPLSPSDIRVVCELWGVDPAALQAARVSATMANGLLLLNAGHDGSKRLAASRLIARAWDELTDDEVLRGVCAMLDALERVTCCGRKGGDGPGSCRASGCD